MGQYVGVIGCWALSVAILYKKKKLQSFGLILVAVLSGIVAGAGGGSLVGLMPTAYLTTIENNNTEYET